MIPSYSGTSQHDIVNTSAVHLPSSTLNPKVILHRNISESNIGISNGNLAADPLFLDANSLSNSSMLGFESHDSIENTRANLSRHVTSVITHFTASQEGYSRIIDELEDFIYIVNLNGGMIIIRINYC